MTEQEAKDFIEQSLGFACGLKSGNYSYSFEMGDGYVSVKRNDGYVINASFDGLTKYSVKVGWDKNITHLIHVEGIDHDGEWQYWSLFLLDSWRLHGWQFCCKLLEE